MKNLLLIILLFGGFASFSQTQLIVSAPKEGFLLDKGWKFQTDDNIEYAKTGYEDETWQPINPAFDIQQLPQLKQGVIWMRLHFIIDSSLIKKSLVLVIEQSGASEIYLNGSLIHTFGIFDSDPAKIRAYDPSGRAINLPVKNTGEHILSVRYALQPCISYNTIFES